MCVEARMLIPPVAAPAGSFGAIPRAVQEHRAKIWWLKDLRDERDSKDDEEMVEDNEEEDGSGEEEDEDAERDAVDSGLHCAAPPWAARRERWSCCQSLYAIMVRAVEISTQAIWYQ